MSTENYSFELYPEDRDISKKWFVALKFTDPQTLESCRKQYRGKINSRKNKTARLKEAHDLIEALKAELKEGWNPITGKVESNEDNEFAEMPFSSALDFALKSKKPTLAPKSYGDISGVVEFAKSAAIKCRIHLAPIIEIRRKHIKMLLNQIGEDRQAVYDKAPKGTKYYKKKFTGNSYNKYKGYLGIIFSELLEYEAVEFNPCDKLNNKVGISTDIHRHATAKEEAAIKAFLSENHPDFYTYLAFEYLTGIRPKELFGLQIKEIDWFNQCLHLKAEDGKTKTKKARMVPIPNALLPYLEKMKLSDYDPEWYVFSDNFLPGEKRKNRADYATKFWKKVVIDGLGINVSLYSFKGLGGEAKREAGIAAIDVSNQYGHSSMGMTMKYLRGEQDRINKDIIERTPEF